jgi:hypothetical protein
LSSTCARLDLLAPDDPGALRAQARVASRLGILIFNDRSGLEAARVQVRRAAALAERWRQVAPGDDTPTTWLVENLVLLGGADLIEDEARGLAGLRRAVELSRESRTQGNSANARAMLALSLTGLGEALVGRDDEAARATMTEAETLRDSAAREDPEVLNELAGLVELRALLGKPAEAWALARRMDEANISGEFEVEVVLGAFAAGEDEVVLARLNVASPVTRDAASCYGALVHAIAGRPREALPLAQTCLATGALERVVWLSRPLAARAKAVPGPVGAALVQLAAELPTALPTRAQADAAWGRFVAALKEASR